MKARRFSQVLAFLLLVTGFGMPARASDVDAALIDRWTQECAQLFGPEEPGAAVLASCEGDVVFRGSFGLASLELGVPVDSDTAFCLASVTKSFTGLATMMLIEQERLFVDDHVTDFLPWLTKAEGVTVEHLLTHTSGIPDMDSAPGYNEVLHQEVSPKELIETIATRELEFEPGERFEYSNINYAILGYLIELVSGQPWETFLKKRIFDPAGMSRSDYGGHRRVLAGAATGYTPRGGEWAHARALSYTRGYGLGGLFSTVNDLERWHQALSSGRYLSEESFEQMTTPFVLNDGSESDYAYGFRSFEIGGSKVVQHSGAIFGWRTNYQYLPKENIFVVALCNRDSGGNVDPRELTDGIARDLLKTLRDRSGQ